MPNLHWGSNYAFWVGSVKHFVVLLTLATAAIGLVAIGRRLSVKRRIAAERLAGLLLIGVWLAGFAFDLANPRASASTTLPLHWCDVCGALAVVVMLWPQYRLPRTLLHFWAICFCSFAFALPAIGLGPAFFDFWIYFGTHTAIILTALYDVGVRRYSPRPRDLGWAFACATAWAIFLQPINYALGANYGFVGPDDHNVRRAIVALGPWPWRIAPMLAITFVMMSVLMLAQQAYQAMLAYIANRRRMPMPSIRLPIGEPQPLRNAA